MCECESKRERKNAQTKKQNETKKSIFFFFCQERKKEMDKLYDTTTPNGVVASIAGLRATSLVCIPSFYICFVRWHWQHACMHAWTLIHEQVEVPKCALHRILKLCVRAVMTCLQEILHKPTTNNNNKDPKRQKPM